MTPKMRRSPAHAQDRATQTYCDPICSGTNDIHELSKTHEVVSQAKTKLIGPIIAMTILAEAGDLRRFRHHRQFLKFCGLDLATHQSGQF